jgi:hypothetical protein
VYPLTAPKIESNQLYGIPMNAVLVILTPRGIYVGEF